MTDGKLKGEKRRGDRTDRLECPLLTGDLNRGWLPSNLTWSRPCHAFALEPLPTEVLLDLVPRHVQLDLHDPRSGARVHEILVLRPLGSVAVTTKIHLQCSTRVGIRLLNMVKLTAREKGQGTSCRLSAYGGLFSSG